MLLESSHPTRSLSLFKKNNIRPKWIFSYFWYFLEITK